MKTRTSILNDLNVRKLWYGLLSVAVMLYFNIQAVAVSKPLNYKTFFAKGTDTSVSAAIRSQVSAHQRTLYFPASVERFYKQNGYKLAWVAPDTVKTHASEAMLLLDCVLHYGLSHEDYHPKELSYDRLRSVTVQGNKVSDSEKASFDIMLTDAMLTFMNNLHYGKLNPYYSAEKIDGGIAANFRAELILENALHQKNFMRAIESSQPGTKEYADMQDHMRLLTGQYQEDCYEVPQEDIRKMAINLERIRWINSDDITYIEINIPAYILKFHQPDTTYQFKTIVGSPLNPTPTLQSAVGYFSTAPDWKVPQSIFMKEILPKALKDTAYLENNHFAIYDQKGAYIQPTRLKLYQIKQNPARYYVRQSPGCENALGLIVFRFSNIYDIYLHDTPEQLLFAKEDRDFSHGCIRVEHAEKLAALLLKNDGAASKLHSLRNALEIYQAKNFLLKKAIPIKITYLTCEVKEGLLINYKDIYNLDNSLEMALYASDPKISMK